MTSHACANRAVNTPKPLTVEHTNVLVSVINGYTLCRQDHALEAAYRTRLRPPLRGPFRREARA
jgi:hypothetical protein